MTRALIILALLSASVPALAEAPPTADVPPATTAPEPRLVWPAELEARQAAVNEQQRAQTLVAAGAGTFVIGYGVSALAAWASDLGNSLGCAIGDAFVPRGQPRPACPTAAGHVLYAPVAGPLIYLANSNRPRDATADGLAIGSELAQLGGLVAATVGVSKWASLPEVKPLSTWHVQLLPAAPGALTGATLQLRL